jgi:hypothetical protein
MNRGIQHLDSSDISFRVAQTSSELEYLAKTPSHAPGPGRARDLSPGGRPGGRGVALACHGPTGPGDSDLFCGFKFTAAAMTRNRDSGLPVNRRTQAQAGKPLSCLARVTVRPPGLSYSDFRVSLSRPGIISASVDSPRHSGSARASAASAGQVPTRSQWHEGTRPAHRGRR